jgi:hypothetical protein
MEAMLGVLDWMLERIRESDQNGRYQKPPGP